MVKLFISNEKRDFSKLKRTISYAFDTKFQKNSIFHMNNEDNKLKAQHNFRLKENKDFNFMSSPHTRQIQQSRYITLDDNFVE